MGKRVAVIGKSREIARQIIGDGGLLPLEHLIRVMRDPQASPSRRDFCAVQALPYLHARLGRTPTDGEEGDKRVIVQIVNFPAEPEPQKQIEHEKLEFTETVSEEEAA